MNKERYERVREIIQKNMSGLGVFVNKVARKAKTNSEIVHRVAEMEDNMDVVELSGSDRVIMEEPNNETNRR